MQTPFRLDNASLSSAEVSAILVRAATERRVCVNKGSARVVLPDFGTILVGKVPADISGFLYDSTDCLISVPETWGIGHIMVRLGVYPSLTQASKNGRGGPLPMGFSQLVFPLNRVKGVLTCYRGLRDWSRADD